MLGRFFILSKEVKPLCLISKEKFQILYQIEIDKDYVFLTRHNICSKAFKWFLFRKYEIYAISVA